MNNYALVLNAGSSSLKFCVFQQPEHNGWRMECKGQVEGFGTAARFLVKSGEGEVWVDRRPRREVRDGREALSVLASWLTSKYPAREWLQWDIAWFTAAPGSPVRPLSRPVS